MLSSILSVLFAVIVIFPFIITILMLFIYKKRGRAPAKSLGEAADWTTLFLFVSVYMLARAIFDYSIGFYMLIAFVIMVLAFAIYERLKVKDFRIIRLLRKVWRLSFLLLLVAYIGLLITGLILQIIAYAT